MDVERRQTFCQAVVERHRASIISITRLNQAKIIIFKNFAEKTRIQRWLDL